MLNFNIDWLVNMNSTEAKRNVEMETKKDTARSSCIHIFSEYFVREKGKSTQTRFWVQFSEEREYTNYIRTLHIDTFILRRTKKHKKSGKKYATLSKEESLTPSRIMNDCYCTYCIIPI